MLNVGHGCPACGAYVRTIADEYNHQCIGEGRRSYSVGYVRAAQDKGDDYDRVLEAVTRPEVVTEYLRGVVDPENYQVTEWIGRDGSGPAEAGESTWGDLWLEENG